MGLPMISYDIDLIIKKELYTTQSNSEISTNTTITFDNTHNLKRDLDMTLTVTSPFSSLTISSITNGCVITVAPSAGIISDEIINVFKDSVYKTSGSTLVELSGVTISNGIFKIEEDYNNQLRFTISPATGTINGVFGWIKPSDVSHVIGYTESFSFNENRELGSKKNNVNDLYTDKLYTQNIPPGDFSIDKLYFENYFLIDNDDTYQIEFKTADDAPTNVDDISTFLCGAKFTTVGYSYSEGDMIKEGLRGNFVKKLIG